jgi:Tol biopolymer transport system component
MVLAQQVMFNTSSGRSAFSASDKVLAYRQIGNTELRWFDRTGKRLDALGPPGRYLDPALSPDGQELAVARVDADIGSSHIWLFDVTRGSGSPLTSGRFSDRSPIWSPDGRLVAFASKRTAFFEIYQKPSNATGDERALTHRGFPAAWSPDGSFVVYYQMDVPGTLGALSLSGAEAATLPRTEFVGQQGQLSPDGRWIAYVSNETGQSEVYVRPFSSVEPKRRISADGGVEPQWRRDGKEIFYLAPDRRLMAVDVHGNGKFTAGAPSPLFVSRAQASTAFIVGRNEYDVSADGQRFLFNVPIEGASSPITVVVNWPVALPR